jgi:hypothetical protein
VHDRGPDQRIRHSLGRAARSPVRGVLGPPEASLLVDGFLPARLSPLQGNDDHGNRMVYAHEVDDRAVGELDEVARRAPTPSVAIG